MSDIIRLLPDSVANQIAAGEVIQRPASVVKELVENSLDAGASHITIHIKDSGRTLIQVIDNGKGMSETDARMAFERHATSKIKSADDLFALNTMGFRGEALASIAAVAQIELRTRQEDSDLGTRLVINGSTVENQEPIATPKGTFFCVRNLFFNIPARRKFLKSNQTELSHIVSEFERIALANPSIGLTLTHNDGSLYELEATNIRQRIAAIFGKSVNQSLLHIELQTPLVNIYGYVSAPDGARKTNQKQFFFVNGRFMRHPYFHKAVLHPYEGLLQTGVSPHYFIYFDVDPASIDVNIHPTKTEISFENAQPIWQMLAAVVKETLGKFNEVPSLDFSTDNSIQIPVWDGNKDVKPPQPKFDSSYNPFKSSGSGGSNYKRADLNWEKLYSSFNNKPEEKQTTIEIEAFDIPENSPHELSPIGTIVAYGGYLVAPSRTGLRIIDQRKAHIRVLYDRYLKQLVQHKGVSQRTLFPEIITLSASDMVLLESVNNELHSLGFEVDNLGGGSFSVCGVPANINGIDIHQLFNEMIDSIRHKSVSIKEDIYHQLALTLARSAAIHSGKNLSQEEQLHLVDQLMASPSPTLTPDGQKILIMLSDNDLDKLF